MGHLIDSVEKLEARALEHIEVRCGVTGLPLPLRKLSSYFSRSWSRLDISPRELVKSLDFRSLAVLFDSRSGSSFVFSRELFESALKDLPKDSPQFEHLKKIRLNSYAEKSLEESRSTNRTQSRRTEIEQTESELRRAEYSIPVRNVSKANDFLSYLGHKTLEPEITLSPEEELALQRAVQVMRDLETATKLPQAEVT